ncbi:MAG: DUF1841 family protein [Nitrospinaceae bacterium]
MQFDKDTQQRILRVAGQRMEDQPIDEIDSRIAHIMDMHPEFNDIWEMGEMAVYPQEIDGKVVNPFVHTVLHVVVDKQILDDSPEFVAATRRRLLAEGAAEHEALHGIIGVYAELYFRNFRRGETFSNLDYKSELEKLSGVRGD